MKDMSKVRAWCAREYARRATGDTRHPSFLAAEVLAAAEEKFSLDTCGVEGWSTGTTSGIQYLNAGDCYSPTVAAVTRGWSVMFRALPSGWASMIE